MKKYLSQKVNKNIIGKNIRKYPNLIKNFGVKFHNFCIKFKKIIDPHIAMPGNNIRLEFGIITGRRVPFIFKRNYSLGIYGISFSI